MSQTFVLITGANRGLGKGLLSRFLAQPNHTVIAANRDPEHPTSKELASLPKGEGSSLIVLKYSAEVEQDAFDIATQLHEVHGVDHLDIVIPNAGIVKQCPLVKDAKRSDIQLHFDVNTYSVVSLYQATRDLLQKSPRQKPIFAPVGSGAGTLGRQPPIPNATYGPSKVAVAWYGIRINAEDEWLNAFVLDPGFVGTEGGKTSAGFLGFSPDALLSVDESVDGMFNVLVTATKEKYGGKVVLYTGEVQEW
ncbi:related to ketoreductase [Cephalotrichum gorgonifer]|uniref:Related to ketoreductase n=1 Tax=Cephalotrichum gorgonifer TaxID=2041049 RepID=A0AAE8STC3_9PEZI|nr:related to ketoreductase [Cephalotrichum gorgonifer]